VLGIRQKESDEAEAAPVADRRQVSVIGKGMRVLGDCECEGDLRVDGTVTGSVRAPRLHIAESGSVAGDVSPLKEGAGEGVFSIAGKVGGAVRAAEVEVRRGGNVVGAVVADRAVVHGRVGGGMVVKDRLSLEESAAVEGDIQARRLAIKEGAHFDGKIKMTETTARERPAPAVAVSATPLSTP
jgi:cytoskeletal protein CcmA (bactofilin family)